jgi:hypothetical protein
LIEKARHHAQELFGQDADLQQPQHALLSVALRRFWEGEKSDLS